METKDLAKPLIRISNLEHSFTEGEGTFHALRGVSFDAFAGEVTAVVGPSGCGKSTLLYLMGLLDRPDSGEIHLEEDSVALANDEIRTNLRNTKIGFVFQFHFLIKELTVCENVALPLRKSGVPEKQALRKAKDVLCRLGLDDKCDRLANKLSGGERQMSQLGTWIQSIQKKYFNYLVNLPVRKKSQSFWSRTTPKLPIIAIILSV